MNFEREMCTGASDDLQCHFYTGFSIVCSVDENMDGSISFNCVIPFCSKPSALRPAGMKEPAQLQIHAVVSVDGLDGHVKKVWTALQAAFSHDT